MNTSLSKYLSFEENNTLSQLIGNGCQAHGVAVAQIYFVNDVRRWVLKRCCVACYIRDNNVKAHFIRLYDIASKTLFLEQELYYEMQYVCSLPRFHTVQCEVGPVGLSFAYSEEAVSFGDHVTRRLNSYAASRSDPHRSDKAAKAVACNPPERPSSYSKLKLKLHKKKKKHTTPDISAPTDFRHVDHVGYDKQTKQFKLDREDTVMMRQILRVIGREDALKSTKDQEFVFNYIVQHGGLQEAQRQAEQFATSGSMSKCHPPPPPVPNTGHTKMNTPVPPPPPVRQSAPAGGGVPPPPPPILQKAPAPPAMQGNPNRGINEPTYEAEEREKPPAPPSSFDLLHSLTAALDQRRNQIVSDDSQAEMDDDSDDWED